MNKYILRKEKIAEALKALGKNEATAAELTSSPVSRRWREFVCE